MYSSKSYTARERKPPKEEDKETKEEKNERGEEEAKKNEGEGEKQQEKVIRRKNSTAKRKQLRKLQRRTIVGVPGEEQSRPKARRYVNFCFIIEYFLHRIKLTFNNFWLNPNSIAASESDSKKQLERLGRVQRDLKMFRMDRKSVHTDLTMLGVPIPPQQIVRAKSAEGNYLPF